mgnify:CR=1 FL=1
MPYILMEDRPKYEGALSTLIATLKEAYPLRYFNINRAMGVLEACKLEHYRRVAAPYEDTIIQTNGDV